MGQQAQDQMLLCPNALFVVLALACGRDDRMMKRRKFITLIGGREGGSKMKLPHRRQFLHLAAGAAALPAVSRIARAQAYPSRPVRVIVPYAPGGPTDIFGRLIAQSLSKHLGKQFYVENI